MYAPTPSGKWILFAGLPLMLSKVEVEYFVKEGYIQDKSGSKNGEMEFTRKYTQQKTNEKD